MYNRETSIPSTFQSPYFQRNPIITWKEVEQLSRQPILSARQGLTVVPKKDKVEPALMDRAVCKSIRHMLSVFAFVCAHISVEYILINKTNVCVLIFGDLPA
jgi:hypothetical protein